MPRTNPILALSVVAILFFTILLPAETVSAGPAQRTHRGAEGGLPQVRGVDPVESLLSAGGGKSNAGRLLPDYSGLTGRGFIPSMLGHTLGWNTFLGGGGNDSGLDLAIDGSGNLYVAGTSYTTWGAPVRAFGGGVDVAVAKLDSSGGLLWNTFLGTVDMDVVGGITLDGAGNVYVSGSSLISWGSPLRAFSGDTAAFVAKLDPATGALVWNTFLGGIWSSTGEGIAANDAGESFVVGNSNSTWGTPVRPYSGDFDAFVAKLNASGALTWNTFQGQIGNDQLGDITVDGSGSVYTTGFSTATWGAPVRAFSGANDAFYSKLNASSGGLIWNTFLGGAGSDIGRDITADGSGNIYALGTSTDPWGIPVRAYGGGTDGFAALLNASGVLIWNTFLGGSGEDYGFSITAGNSGTIHLAGSSDASWGNPVRAFSSATDSFIVEVNGSGAVLWNTFLGGSGNDSGYSVVVDDDGNAYISGNSSDTWGTPVRAYTGGVDGFVAKVENPAPETFAKMAPGDGALVNTNPTIAWTGSSGADYYIYCVDTTNNGICDTAWEYAGTSMSVGLTGLGNNDTYYWFVAAGNESGATYADGGTWWSFTARNQTFADVPIDHSLWEYIEAFYTAGITGGCGFDPLIFCPGNNVTRAAMAVFLLRAKYGSGYEPPPATHTFADLPVAGKEWQEAWVDQFYLEGITSGCGTSPLIYCPENPVTRAAMAVFILRALEGASYTPPAASHFFADMPVAGKEWMEPWVDEVYRRGITTGCGTGPLIFCPETAVKRQAMAAFIVRAFNLPLP